MEKEVQNKMVGTLLTFFLDSSKQVAKQGTEGLQDAPTHPPRSDAPCAGVDRDR